MNYFVSFIVGNQIDEEERNGRFSLIIFTMSCGCKYSVALPYRLVGLAAVYDCNIS